MISRNFKYRTLIFISFFVCLCSGCIDTLDFIGETQEGQIVIYGLLTDIEGNQQVDVGITRNFGLAQESLPGAQVTLRTDSGNAFSYESEGDGKHVLYNFKAEPNVGYYLTVFAQGKTYVSDTTVLSGGHAIDKLRFSFTFEPIRSIASEPVFTVFADSDLHASADQLYLRWKVEETYLWQLTSFPPEGPSLPPPSVCFIRDVMDPTRLNLFTNAGTNTRRTSQVMAKRLVDNSFIGPFFVSVTQLSISRKAFEYWERIKIMLNNQGSLFDVPPAPVIGNIRNPEDSNERVLGYFEVAKAQVSRIYTISNDVPFFLNPPCLYVPGKDRFAYSQECLDCRVRARGRPWTHEAPPWWRFD